MAELLSITAGAAKLRKEDGSTVEIPLDKLCDEDRQFINAYRKKRRVAR